MKNIIFFPILLIFFSTTSAQTYSDTIKVTRTGEVWAESVNGELQSFIRPVLKRTFTKHEGYNEIYDENGYLSYTGTYIGNIEKAIENGLFRYYYTNGNIENEVEFINGNKTGLETF